MSKCIESILVYGPSGSGKTTQVQELALWVMRSNRKVRLISASGGGWTSITPAVEKGIVIPTLITGRKYPTETIDKMTKGWWPEHPDDPESPLIPPSKQKDWDEVGGIALDSISEAASWLMETLVQREARGEIKISQLAIRYKDGDTDYGSAALAHYGNAQGHMSAFIRQLKTIPDRYILATALELRATEENTKLPLYGPDVVGKAKTSVAPAWFDNTLHLYLTGSGGLKKGAAVRRMYFNTHFEDDGVPFIAKNRGHYYAPISSFVNGLDYLEGRDCSVYTFLGLLDRSHSEAMKRFEVEMSKQLTPTIN